MNLGQKLTYLVRSTKSFLLGQSKSCPECGAQNSIAIDRKFIVTTLRRCKNCELLFRAPTSDHSELTHFYQSNYQEGFTTDLPDDNKLDELIKTHFSGTEKDYKRYIDVLSALDVGDRRVFDFGCSWGYGAWQMREAGYHVDAFEISVPRAEFARSKLGLNLYPNMQSVPPENKYDVFFSSHVLEHLPSIATAVKTAKSLLSEKGLFLSFVPNGSLEYRKHNPIGWHKSWGYVHPNLLDEKFFMKLFSDRPLFIASSPFNLVGLKEWSQRGGVSREICDLRGEELLVVAKK